MPSLTDLIEQQILPGALKCGIKLFEFWEMTLKEIKLVIESYAENKNNELEQQKHYVYNNAYLTAVFVGCLFNGKQLPTISEVFPEVKSEETQDNNVLIIKEKLLDFAEQVNKRRQK